MKIFYRLANLKWIGLALMTLCLSSCHKGGRIQAFRYYENAKEKPVVALVPVICRVPNPFSWDLSQELTSEIQRRILGHANLYLNPMNLSVDAREKLESQDIINLTSNDFNEFKGSNEFIVLIELIDYTETPNYHSEFVTQNPAEGQVALTLSMKTRIRIYDLRAENPRVILQEVLQLTHQIPKDTLGNGYKRVMWGSDAYNASPYGRAHLKMERDLAAQIEKYISIAK